MPTGREMSWLIILVVVILVARLALYKEHE
jgi:hypothetical protein